MAQNRREEGKAKAKRKLAGFVYPDDPRVGFYGCQVIDRVVRVGVRDGVEKYPRSEKINCPCGNRHLVAIKWRSLNQNEPAWVEVQVGVPKEEAE